EELLQELKRISSVRLEGRHRLPSGTLRRAMKTRGPSVWPWRKTPLLRFDYLRADTLTLAQIYRRYGFLDVRIEYQVKPGRRSEEVAVIFRIHEGGRSKIRGVHLPGAVAISSRDLARRLWARAGRDFDDAYLQLDTLRIAGLYQEKGYFPTVAASYARHPADSLSIEVTYEIHEGDRFLFGSVAVRGQKRVPEKLVTRELVLPAGKVYQRSRVLRSQE